MKRPAMALATLALVFATAAGCDDKGRVIQSNLTDETYPRCTLVIRPDGVDANGDPKPVFRLRDRRESDCRKCPVNSRWPDCLKKELPNGMETM